MIAERYYFNKLSSKEKDIYKKLYRAILALEPKVNVFGIITMETIQKIAEAITNDNPHLFYFNQSYMLLQTTTTNTVVLPQYFFNVQEIKTLNKKIEDSVNKIIQKLDLRNIDDEYEREKRIHDVLAQQVTYDHAAITTKDTRHIATAHSIVGVFISKNAVCEGIAKAVKILLNTANIKCIVVTGQATLEADAGHAWNIVKIDNNSYHLDATWDIANTSSSLINYDYFNLTDMEVQCDHSGYFGTPVCLSSDMNYFIKNELTFAGISEVKKYIKWCLQSNMTSFYFKLLDKQINMKNCVNSLIQYALSVVVSDGYNWIAHSSYNESQKTAYINLRIRV